MRRRRALLALGEFGLGVVEELLGNKRQNRRYQQPGLTGSQVSRGSLAPDRP
jgi:hypothetical protein